MGCTAAVDAAHSVLNSQKIKGTFEDMIKDIVKGYNKITGHNIEIDLFCKQLYELCYTNIIAAMNKNRVCDESLGLCTKPAIEEIDVKKVVDDILKEKPSQIRDDNFINNMYSEVSRNLSERTILKAVHISDTHMDFEYKIGAKVKCGGVVCCREESGMELEFGESGAREWGEYECDPPKKTFDNMLDYIVTTVKPDVLFWTGDNSPHNTYDNTEEEVLNYTVTTTQMIKDKLAGSNITVVPIQGNHDTWPVDF